MIIPLKYGIKRTLLGVYDPYPFQCPHCKELDTIDFAIYGEYYHVWNIPICPYEKDGYAKCNNCDFHINSLKFNRITKEQFIEIKKKYKYPFYYYTALIFLLSLPVLILLSFVLG